MKLIIIIHLVIISSYSQLTIEVLRFEFNPITMEIENYILERVKKLHYLKTNQKLIFKFKTLKKFSQILPTLKQSKKLYIMAISGISITKSRKKKFMFTNPYIFVDDCIVTNKNYIYKADDWMIKNTRIAYTQGTNNEKRLKILEKQYKIKPVMFNTLQDRATALKNGVVKFAIANNIFAWGDSTIKVIYNFKNDDTPGYGIAFNKDSPLKVIFDPYIAYIIKSAYFKKLLKKFYGKFYDQFYNTHFYTK